MRPQLAESHLEAFAGNTADFPGVFHRQPGGLRRPL